MGRRTLAAQLRALLGDEFDLSDLGFDEDDLADLGFDEPDGEDLDNDPGEIEPPANPVTRPGDLWLLDGHRLLCGDSTSTEDMDRLMAGETATLLATDPPYLVDYDGTNHPSDHHKKAGRERTEEGEEVGNKHWDAYKDPAASVEFFRAFLVNALRNVAERAPVYQWHATKRQVLVERAWEEAGLFVHQSICWAKSRAVLTRSHFLWQHEPAFYGWRPGMQPPKDRRPDTTATTVWEIGQAGENDGIHPTQKPLEIFTRPIQWHTKKGEVCLEPFSGSGSQLVAAESLGRRCFAMEKAPEFVDAGLLRWQAVTGKCAVFEGDGRTYEEVAVERGVAAGEPQGL